jgi:hypothetical protein
MAIASSFRTPNGFRRYGEYSSSYSAPGDAPLLSGSVRLLTFCSVLVVAPHVGGVGKVAGPVRRSELASAQAYCAQLDAFVDANRLDALRLAEARPSGSSAAPAWKVFASDDEREQADADSLANVWVQKGRVAVVALTLQSSSRDWVLFATFYFRPDGTLAKIDSTLNTFYGDLSVERVWFYDRGGKTLDFHTAFYDLQTRKRVRPNRDFVDKVVPRYETVRRLPFWKLVRPTRNAWRA